MEKLYIVKTRKMVLGLGIMGPLTSPVRIEDRYVLDMVSRGYEVWAVNPKDTTEQIKLTPRNVKSITFKNTRATGVRQRKTNKEFQDIEKPIVVGVVSDGNENVTISKQNDNKKKEDKKKNNSQEEEKITAPDAFEK